MLGVFANAREIFDSVFSFFGIYEILGAASKSRCEQVCSVVTESVCNAFTDLLSIGRLDPTVYKYNSDETIKVLAKRELAGASLKQLLHYAQLS